MADNYLERQYDEYLKAKAAKDAARKEAWRKQMDAYKKRLKAAKAGGNKGE